MNVWIKAPCDLLQKDHMGMCELTLDARQYLKQSHSGKIGICRYAHQVTITFDTDMDAMMFKMKFSDRMT